ncbi:hypothetical protein ACS6JK_19130 [Enterobacter chuandaensis]|uniref:hypothetical protein n=1 Tax=Enterobacter TaxID=547 RepID=UPI00387E3789
MNPTLRFKLVGAIDGGSGAITVAEIMLGNADRLEGRRYYAYQDVVGVWAVCDDHIGADIRRGEATSIGGLTMLPAPDLLTPLLGIISSSESGIFTVTKQVVYLQEYITTQCMR